MKGFPKVNFDNRYLYFGSLGAVLILLLFYFVALDARIREYVGKNKVESYPLDFSLSSYPILATKNKPDISALAAVVLDDDSKKPLFSKNANLLFSMASTTKIMTALIGLSYYKMDDILTINSDNIEGVKSGFERGQRVKFEDLLYAMLLPSSNDAAQAIADNYPGGETAFVREMNKHAESLHLYNTHFADPIGLLDEADYSTPLDLARLTSVALENEVFSQIVATKSKVVSDVDGKVSLSINNLNRLLGKDGVNGVKTGYTDGAGQVLVTSREDEGRRIISVVMASKDRFLDTQRLLDLITDNIIYLPIHP
ncbi:MAG: D-alanyl-D-alanine carboxypeptidase-like protein [uncultured bacterium]|nr:MAG: D-alanyl-D-alanine carboxypeptidase-like protein [uncultured bacterium]OGH13496.1 MAG: hypothetical protein A2687_00220 [Candidatus Levybacteria bacterium RIFCSPHIGHO2_01_FULL_38_26]